MPCSTCFLQVVDLQSRFTCLYCVRDQKIMQRLLLMKHSLKLKANTIVRYTVATVCWRAVCVRIFNFPCWRKILGKISPPSCQLLSRPAFFKHLWVTDPTVHPNKSYGPFKKRCSKYSKLGFDYRSSNQYVCKAN